MFLLKKHIICESFGQTKPPILTFKASHYEIDDFIISNSPLISFPQVSKESNRKLIAIWQNQNQQKQKRSNRTLDFQTFTSPLLYPEKKARRETPRVENLDLVISCYSGTNLSSLAADSASELDVLGHDGDSLGVNGAEIGVLKETNQVRLRRLLESSHSAALKPQIRLKVLSNLPNQPLERQLPDQKLSALLVLPDLPQRHRSGPEPVGLLHSSRGRRRLPSSLGGQLLSRSLPSRGLPSGLLGASHFTLFKIRNWYAFVQMQNDGTSC